MVTLSPVGLAAAPVANQVSFLATFTYAGHLVLSTEKSGLTSEVEAQKANAEQVLASASKAQNIIDKAPSLLAELNPMYKEKQETEQRFGKIEGSIGEMKELMKKQQEMMENFIKKFES